MAAIEKAPRYAIDDALALLKNGDIRNARAAPSLLTDPPSDQEFVQAMINLEQGLALFEHGNHPESCRYLQMAQSVIDRSTDEEGKFLVNTLTAFAEGVSRLLGGDAHGAIHFLDISSDAIERLAKSCSTRKQLRAQVVTGARPTRIPSTN